MFDENGDNYLFPIAVVQRDGESIAGSTVCT
jgi:hypothetical protein